MSEINPNNLNKHGHKHPPRLYKAEVAFDGVSTDTDRNWHDIAFYSIVVGACNGLLVERGVNMFEETAEYALESGIITGILTAASISIVGYIKNTK